MHHITRRGIETLWYKINYKFKNFIYFCYNRKLEKCHSWPNGELFCLFFPITAK